MMKRRYTDAQLIKAVQSSTSIRQVLSKLELVEAGGNYANVNRRIRELGVATEHFTGQGWKKGNQKPVIPAQPLSLILQKGTVFQSFKLKKRLFAEGFKEKRCERCSQSEWQGQPIPLELDHINGDTTDNRLVNLRILCPNCQALTETYRGKKLAKRRDETAPS
jgi:HNH endonuclease